MADVSLNKNSINNKLAQLAQQKQTQARTADTNQVTSVNNSSTKLTSSQIQAGIVDGSLSASKAVSALKTDVGKDVKAILFNASASASSGFEFPSYVASKAGIVGYMKYVASKVAPNGVTCNSISFGGIMTNSNQEVMKDSKSWEKIMEVTPMKKWISLDEVNEWVYFLLTKNKSMSGEDLLIDNGEYKLNNTFVWPNY